MRFVSGLPFSARERRHRLGAGLAFAGIAAGAAAAALLVPASRRRSVVDRTARAGRDAAALGRRAVRDLGARSQGVLAWARSAVHDDRPPDEALCERVRSRLGRMTSRPDAIEIVARGGVVELRGPVLAEEAELVLRGVRRVRGVVAVEDRLHRHARADGVTGLEADAPSASRATWQDPWPPGTRVVALLVGAGLATASLSARVPGALSLGAMGALLTLRGATNRPVRRTFRLGSGRPGTRHGAGAGTAVSRPQPRSAAPGREDD